MPLDIESCNCAFGNPINQCIGLKGHKTGCNNRLTGSDQASRDQRQRIIQKTVRVEASQYIMNLKAFTVRDINQTPSTNSQMSDRAYPSGSNLDSRKGGVFRCNVPTRGNTTKTSVISSRPGSSSAPVTSHYASHGVDVKHGSYDRYLAKKKGKSALRAGRYSDTSDASSRPTAIHGGKNVKFGIIKRGCKCTLPV